MKHSAIQKFGIIAESCTVAASPDQRRIVVVRRHRHRVRLRHRGDVEHRADAAAIADVRIDDVGRARRQRLGEGFLRVDRLAGDDRHTGQRTPHLRDQFDVVAQARFLVPADVELGDALADADRVHRRQPAMHLHQQGEVRAQRLAHRLDVAHDVVFVLAMDEVAPRARGTGPISAR